jgi:hypothetical protein
MSIHDRRHKKDDFPKAGDIVQLFNSFSKESYSLGLVLSVQPMTAMCWLTMLDEHGVIQVMPWGDPDGIFSRHTQSRSETECASF